MKIRKMAVLALAAGSLALSACGGGSGNTSVGGVKFTHSQLAQDFVKTVNAYMANYDLELVKTNTLEYNYIVVYDYVYGTYDAYYLGYYNPGENIASYLKNYDHKFYYGLYYEGNGYYRDPITGTLFDKQEISLDNYMKAAVRQKAYKDDVASKISASFGLSMNTADSLAQAYVELASVPSDQISATVVDRMAKQAFGFSMSEVESEIAAGNKNAIDEALASAEVKTGMPAEVLEQKLKEAFKIDLALIRESL